MKAPATTPESVYSTRAVLRFNRRGYRLWRNNVGVAFYPIGEEARRLFESLVRRRKAGRVRHGLCVGSADHVGFHLVTVTPDMVGQVIPVFTGVEIKTMDGKLRKEQKTWLDGVDRAGGEAWVVVGDEDIRHRAQASGGESKR